MTARASRSALVSWTLTEAPAGAGATKAAATGRQARATASFCGGDLTVIFLQGALGVRCVIYGCDVCGRMAGRWCSGLPEVAPEQWRHAAHRAYGSGGEPPQAAAVGSFSGPCLTTDPRACQGLSILHHRQAKGCAVPNSIAQTARRRPDVPTRAVRVRLTAGGSTDRRHLRAASASARRAALLVLSGSLKQRCVVFGPGGSAIFAMDLQSILLE